MRKFRFSKLVRDKIVQQIIDSEDTPNWRTLSNDSYIYALKNKILEEAQEVPDVDGEDLIKELADIQEILDNLLQALDVSQKDFAKIQKKKNYKAGSFKNKHYIEDVETHEDSKWLAYYLANPEKYPEIF